MEERDVLDVRQQIINFISQNSPANGVVIGLSGGIDSTLLLKLCTEALGKKRTFGVFMPETEADISGTIKQYVEKLGVQHEVVPIKPIADAYSRYGSVSDKREVIGNLKARIRMSLLYSRSNAANLVVMGTGNRSELLTGYFTKYGDGGVDYLPIGDLYKTQVWELAKHLDLPEPIITQPPSADLWAGQTDEKELGITYSKLDQILHEHFDKQTPYEKIQLPDITQDDVKKVQLLVKKAASKLKTPPICQINK